MNIKMRIEDVQIATLNRYVEPTMDRIKKHYFNPDSSFLTNQQIIDKEISTDTWISMGILSAVLHSDEESALSNELHQKTSRIVRRNWKTAFLFEEPQRRKFLIVTVAEYQTKCMTKHMIVENSIGTTFAFINAKKMKNTRSKVIVMTTDYPFIPLNDSINAVIPLHPPL